MGRLHGMAEARWSGLVGSRGARRWRVSLAVLAVGVGGLGLSGCVADPPPRIGTAVAGDSQATVTWQEPLAAPSPITAYVVTPWIGFVRQTPVVFNSTATTQVVTGLANGTTYTFTVVAINARGDETASSDMSNAVTPTISQQLYGWGDNGNGQVGDGWVAQRVTPSQVGTTAEWASVSAGGFHTMTVKTDGTLWAWGANDQGQLGDGTITNHTSPVQVGTATNWASVAGGGKHTVAVRTDGTLWAWGDNTYGQLGDGTTIDHSSPAQVGTATDWASAAASSVHTVALKTDGTLWAWGRNTSGQLGIGTTGGLSTIPVQVGTATDWASAAAGGYYGGADGHTVAVKTDGTLWTWGRNHVGQLGDGTTTNHPSPVQVGPDTNWAVVAAGAFYTVAVKTDGILWAWGDNSRGQLGLDADVHPFSTIPIQPRGTDTNWAGVAAGAFHTMAVKTDGTLWTWGDNTSGQLGYATIPQGFSLSRPRLAPTPTGPRRPAAASTRWRSRPTAPYGPGAPTVPGSWAAVRLQRA